MRLDRRPIKYSDKGITPTLDLTNFMLHTKTEDQTSLIAHRIISGPNLPDLVDQVLTISINDTRVFFECYNRSAEHRSEISVIISADRAKIFDIMTNPVIHGSAQSVYGELELRTRKTSTGKPKPDTLELRYRLEAIYLTRAQVKEIVHSLEAVRQ